MRPERRQTQTTFNLTTAVATARVEGSPGGKVKDGRQTPSDIVWIDGPGDTENVKACTIAEQSHPEVASMV